MISKIDIKDYEKAMQEGKYEDLSKDYKNYEENMKEYQKNKMENYE